SVIPTSVLCHSQGERSYNRVLSNFTEEDKCRIGYDIKDLLPLNFAGLNCYQNWADFYCYFFISPSRRKYNLRIGKINAGDPGGYGLPLFYDPADNITRYIFDHSDSESWPIVRQSLINAQEADKLDDCCNDAANCCLQMLQTPSQKQTSDEDTSPLCPRTWDGWSCFPDASTGDVLEFDCPVYAYTATPKCMNRASKTCTTNGTWLHNPAPDYEANEWTDYGSCSLEKKEVSLLNWDIALDSLSLIALLPAMCILLIYKALRIQRFYIHFNFFLALFGKHLTDLLVISVIKLPEEKQGGDTLINENTGGCKFLVVMSSYFNLAVYTWMLTEGLYLHRLIAAAFKGQGRTYIYLLIGWATPMVFTISWAIAKAVLQDYQCFLGFDEGVSGPKLYWINDAPRLVILFVNLGILVNIYRVLMTTLKNVNTNDAKANRKAARATAFLLPLFGVQFIFLMFTPPYPTRCSGRQAYDFISSMFDCLQGLYITMVYCFLNNEVQNQLKRTFTPVFAFFNRRRSSAVEVQEQVTRMSTINSANMDSTVPNISSTVTQERLM
ncbi:unnamed protein product, partial [Meganyctiphanes norvegica]